MRFSELEAPAGTPWVDTGIDVSRGDRIEIHARGRWSDAGIDCDPDGHDAPNLRVFRTLRRCRAARWLQLTACVTRDLRHAVPVGTMSRFSAPADGRLYLFANDARAMYWNNHGLAHVRIEVLARDRTAASSAEQRSGPASSHPPAKAPEPKAADSV